MNIEAEKTIYEICKKVDKEISSDFGGGSPVSKTFLMSYLASNQKLKTYVEIGVYKGKSLFSIAYSIYKNGGKSYGIDPYLVDYALESDIDEDLKLKLDDFLLSRDFETLYKDILIYKNECNYEDAIKIIRKTSNDAVEYFKEQNIHPDLLHIDGNHDMKNVQLDYEEYYQLMENGSFIVFDDINWESVKAVYEKAKKENYCLFENDFFGILMKDNSSVSAKLKAEKLTKKLFTVYDRMIEREEKGEDYIPNITVGILTYNHEKYVEQALESVLEQQGNFRLHVIICDDCSTDNTVKVIENFLNGQKLRDDLQIDFYKSEANIGVVKNFNKLVNLIREIGCDFFSFCEGDDYYATPKRLATHLEFCKLNPQTALSYNQIMFYWQADKYFEVYNSGFQGNILSTEELAKQNYIGNLNVGFYCGDLLYKIDDSLFDNMFTGDWMFNLFCSQFGDVNYLGFPYTVYRKHSEGMWSGKKSIEKNRIMLNEIENYNRYLNFTYNAEFQHCWDTIHYSIINMGENYLQDVSVAIIDTIFPHSMSGFRYQEFSSILNEIPNSVVYTTGEDVKILGNDTIDELLVTYKRNNPEMANRIFFLKDENVICAKLLYCTFLSIAYYKLICYAEKYKIPFIFTLYPGGGLALGTEKGDKMLKRVFDSPWFYKVIVTQDNIYKYLLEKGFCQEEQIELIFGVVMPLEKIEKQVTEKKHYGINKKTLDICFVAHKYTKQGEDKGYDIFIAVAKILSKKYNFIHFHVVGSWDEKIINTEGIQNITFYGSQGQDWFDEFYKDKDIILSPNINGKIFDGSFDGFPTGCVTDAAIRDVAMFLTDPLLLNNNRFIDGEEIVIVQHSVTDVVEKIEYYLDKPEKLKVLCENGREKVKKLYNYDAQISTRLKVLQKGLDASFKPNFSASRQELYSTNDIIFGEVSKLRLFYIKYIPEKGKQYYRLIKHYANSLYIDFAPNIVKSIYRKIKKMIKR